MVASKENNVFGVFEFVTEEKLNSFYRVVPTIYKVSDEDIAWTRELPSDLKQLQYIIELAMNIPTDDNWRFGLVHIGLFEQKLLDLVA